MLRASLVVVVLAATAATVAGDGAGSWNYDRCDRLNGPPKWADLCQGSEQSPINLCGAVNLPYAGVLTMSGMNSMRMTELHKEGGVKFVIDVADSPSMTTNVGQIPQTVGRVSPDVAEDVTWNLEQAHFHWGRTGENGEGSEHYMENLQYPLEVHFVHFNSKYASVTDAVTSGNSDALLVVGQMYQVTESGSEASILTSFGDQISESRRQKEGTVSFEITPSELLDTSGGFYAYAGSLTTPTCNPAVTWINLAKPMMITQATLDKFRDVKREGVSVADHGNYRNLMPLGSRLLYKSSDVVQSNFCPNRGVIQPEWEGCSCTSAATGFRAALAGPLLAALMTLAAALRM